MDLRTIINNDAAPNPPNPPPPPSPHSVQHFSPSHQYAPDPLIDHNPPRSFPSPPRAFPSSSRHSPAPIQPVSSYPAPAQNYPPPPSSPHSFYRPPAVRSPSYSSITSPYQHNAAPPIATAPGHHYRRSLSPARGLPPIITGSQQPHQHWQYQQPVGGPPLASPYTPHPMTAPIQYHDQQQSYFAPRRSNSDMSVQSQFLLVHSFLSNLVMYNRESPHSAVSQHSYYPPQYSPAQRSMSVTTPLGPPSAPYTRPSPQASRPHSSGHDLYSQSQYSSPFHNAEHGSTMSPTAKPAPLPPRRNSRKSEQQVSRHPSTDMDTGSVSPKTIGSNSRQNSAAGSQGHISPPGRQEEKKFFRKESIPGPVTHVPTPAPAPSLPPKPITDRLVHSPPSSPHTISSNDIAAGNGVPRPVPAQKDIGTELKKESTPPRPPKRKKLRYSEPPIYARQPARSGGKCPTIPNPRAPIPKHASGMQHRTWTSRKASPSTAQSMSEKARIRESFTNGPPPRASKSATPQQEDLPEPSSSSSSWDPSIQGFIPYEEITKVVCDFLFQHVVLRTDAAAGSAGAAAAGQAPIVEVEAKLGRHIDIYNNERLHLPVLTETVLNHEDPRCRTIFESSMSLVSYPYNRICINLN